MVTELSLGLPAVYA